jgi:hypothetical protein
MEIFGDGNSSSNLEINCQNQTKQTSLKIVLAFVNDNLIYLMQISIN